MPFSDALKNSVKQRCHFTCCWCRDNRNKVEVHHIIPQAEGGPDTEDNAAPLCSNCHTLYGANPDLRKEIRLRRDQWYSLCPQPTEPHDDLTKALLLEVLLIPHEWKNAYMATYPGHFAEGTFERTQTFSDVWDMMENVASHKYSPVEWKKYLPLLSVRIEHAIDRLERAIMMFPSEMPAEIKLAILRTNSQLRAEARVYQMLPHLGEAGIGSDAMFTERFRSVLRVLGELSRMADSETERYKENIS